MERKIQHIRNIVSGNETTVDEWIIPMSIDQIHELRDELKRDYEKNRTVHVCAICNGPIYLAGNQCNEFYFKHYKDSNCPIKTRGKLSQKEIDARRYNGAKESQKHKDLKNHLYRFLSLDPQLIEIRKDKVFKDKETKNSWKRPDIYIRKKDIEVAIEIQLSTTYLDVIVKREVFYERNGIFTLWIFVKEQMSEFRFTEKDIFYNNNRNGFIIDEKSIDLSNKNGMLYLCCYYETPSKKDKFKKEYITLSSLKRNYNRYDLFYYNYNKEKQNIFCLQFQEYWLNRYKLEHEVLVNQDKAYIYRTNRLFGFELKNFNRIESVLNALYSIKNRKIIGYKFNKLIQVVNNVLHYRKEFHFILIKALIVYKKYDAMYKVESFRNKIMFFEKERPKQNNDYDNLFFKLFPEINN